MVVLGMFVFRYINTSHLKVLNIGITDIFRSPPYLYRTYVVLERSVRNQIMVAYANETD